MTNAIPVIIPMETVNDETVTLVQWMIADGAEVQEGQSLAEVETSKAVIELIAPCDGVIRLKAESGLELKIGTVVAYVDISTFRQQSEVAIDGTATQKKAIHSTPDANSSASSHTHTRFSKKALELVNRHGLSVERFGSLTMVREADVTALLNGINRAKTKRNDLHFSLLKTSLNGVTQPAIRRGPMEGMLDPAFLEYVRNEREIFGKLNSNEKCDEYKIHGAIIGENVVLGQGAVLVAPKIVLEDGVQIGDGGSVNCSEQFIVGRLSSFRDGLSVEGTTVIFGENVFGCRRVEISGGTGNPWSVLYVGDTTFIGDDVILDISRPVVIGKEVFLTQRSIIITHNIGHSILDGYENRFEPVVLEDYCQVGMNSTIYAGCRIGSHAIIASNSYVITSIPAGKLALGVPASVIRDAFKLLSRKQQIQIARQMVYDFRELLLLKGYDVSQAEYDGFTLKYENRICRLYFMETCLTDAIDFTSNNEIVIWSLDAFDGPISTGAVFNLLAKTMLGEGGVFTETAREFLRKRGIRFQPGPWRYRHGLI
ncbi:MAG: biotin/lipoyl-containing protein [Terracidiphilus sp.]